MKTRAIALLLPAASAVLLAGQTQNRTTVRDLAIGAPHVLDTAGFSGDLAYSPGSGTLHAVWVAGGDLRYATLGASGAWSRTETIPDGGRDIYGEEEDHFARKCAGVAVDESGAPHVVFAERGGDIWYVRRAGGRWSAPELVVAKQGYSIYPDIEAHGGELVVSYEDANADHIYLTERRDGKWSAPRDMGRGESPSLVSDGRGRMLLLWRVSERVTKPRRARYAYRTPGAAWAVVPAAIAAEVRLGATPAAALGADRALLAWSNSTGINGPRKSEVYCAASAAPDRPWTPRLGSAEPLFYESTGDPHPRVAAFADGTALLMNGRTQPRLMLWRGGSWSGPRQAPWKPGIIQVAGDGRNVYVISSSSRAASGEVSVTRITHPGVVEK